MSKQTEFLPFKEYPSTLARYSNSDQLQAHQYKTILESELGQAYYQREFPTIGDAALGRLNANVPVRNNTVGIVVDNKPVNVYEQFWQYKQNGGTIFTDWTSAGISNLNTDISVSEMPLHGDSNLKDQTLVLSNTNNVRNNLQRYGKEYLTTTNLLNSIAFNNGVSYESGCLSPLRTGSRVELEQIEHSNFADRENGDLYSRQIKQLDVSLPVEYANNTRSHWVYINCAYIRPNKKLKVFHLQQKFGIFDLDSMKMTGESCLTENFNVTPKGLDGPRDVLNDRRNYPPVSNPDFYEEFRRGNEEGVGSNMYCSANTNFVIMPKNHAYENLDTSFQVMPGNNSVTLGTVMSPKLREFIQNDLFNFNRKVIVMNIYSQYSNLLGSEDVLRKLEHKFPEIFKHLLFEDPQTGKKVSMYHYYMFLSEDNKYKFIFNYQRNFAAKNQPYPELETFINHLNIFKFSGHDVNNPEHKGSVLLRELNGILGLHIDDTIMIDSPGCFLLLPTMLSQDIFAVRENIPEQFSGTVSEINREMHDSTMRTHRHRGGHGTQFTPIVNNSPNPNDPNECITHTDPWNYELNATNCAFRDSSGRWIQREHPNFIPNMFNDPNNLNNDIYNLDNPFAGANPYGAPTGF